MWKSILTAVVVAVVGCGEMPEAEMEHPTSKLVGAPARPVRTMAVMMFDISGGAPSAATLQNLIFDGPTSMRKMYQEISNGMQDVQGDLLGPYQLPVPNCLTIACCGPTSDRTGNGATVMQLIAALPKTYDHYFWAYGRIPAGANCGTWGDEGAPDNIAHYSSYSFHQLVGYTQEVGHNFGMTHESTMSCNGVTMPDDPSTCTHNEYGNTLTFMGGGGHHPSAHHKAHQGWLSGCNVVKVGSSAQFTLVPQELPCGGVQLLQIPAPKVRTSPNGSRLSNYYVEMRGPYGAFDKNLPAMVTISIGDDFHTTRQNAPYVYLLDLTPATTSQTDGGLKVGQPYTDPAGGLTITLDALDNLSATVTVTTTGTAALTCRDATVFTPPGMGSSSCDLAGVGGASGTTGSGGATGSGGRAGSGGATGTAGRGGSTATATGGRPGTGGASSGTDGGIIAGTGGRAGTSSGGSGALPGGGIDGGLANDGGGMGPGATPSDVSGGCACTVPGSPGSSSSGLAGIALLLGLGLVGASRRRRSRRSC
jgi:MYXO-CTERM domain-containing protein